jgi:MFS family permease
VSWLPRLTLDGWLLFATYGVRLIAYGSVSVILGLYLAALGFEAGAIGLVFTAAVGGGGVMTALLTWVADRWGRRRVLVMSALLMAAAGAVFATSTNVVLLFVAAALGTLSPSGSEIGPFLSIEQAMLPQTTTDQERTRAFSAYNVVGQGLGAIGSGAAAVPALLGAEALEGYRAVMWAYAVAGLLLAILFGRLSERVEAQPERTERRPGFGLRRARGTAAKFAGLYALDSLGSGFVVQGLVFYWFNLRFGIDVKGLGAIAVGTDVLAALSFLAAPWVAAHVGLLLAAILPHVISNVLVMCVPLMPTWSLAVGGRPRDFGKFAGGARARTAVLRRRRHQARVRRGAVCLVSEHAPARGGRPGALAVVSASDRQPEDGLYRWEDDGGAVLPALELAA